MHTGAGGLLNLVHKEWRYCWKKQALFNVLGGKCRCNLRVKAWLLIEQKGQTVPLSSEMRCNHICGLHGGKSQ